MTDPIVRPGPAMSGRHELPPRFHGGAVDATAPLAARSRRRKRWIYPAVAVLVLCVGAGVQLGSHLAYDDARAKWEDASGDWERTREESAALVLQTQGTAAAGRTILSVGTDALLPAQARGELEVALKSAEDAAVEADAKITSDAVAPPSKPAWFWSLIPAAAALRDDTAAAREADADLKSLADDLDVALDTLTTAGSAALVGAAGAVPAIETENRWARTADVIALREAGVDAAAAGSDFDELSGDIYQHLEQAVEAVRVSAAQELDEKSGDLYDVRLEIEDYARSIAGGVLLDFDWADIVNGHGDNGSAGGTATWNSASGGFSTITLSNSVAEMWPSEVMRALVTHEVGHAIAAKCWEKFDWEDQAANEAWATAWALSMGHTAEGNGASLYGYPEQSMIDAAASCR